jgi:hypothetical protein
VELRLQRRQRVSVQRSADLVVEGTHPGAEHFDVDIGRSAQRSTDVGRRLDLLVSAAAKAVAASVW